MQLPKLSHFLDRKYDDKDLYGKNLTNADNADDSLRWWYNTDIFLIEIHEKINTHMKRNEIQFASGKI